MAFSQAQSLEMFMELDIYIRAYLWPHVFIHLCINKGKANEAMNQLNKDSYKLRKTILELSSEGLKGEYDFPSYINNNMTNFIRALSYLEHGNPELESNLDKDLVTSAKEKALNDVRHRLEDLMSYKARGYISLEK